MSRLLPSFLRALLVVTLGASATATFTGCAQRLQRVRPWEREQLSRRDMRLDTQQADLSFRTHVHGVREGSEGGSGSAGGGCGCN